jgi:TP901 family phage tail tape measure protein
MAFDYSVRFEAIDRITAKINKINSNMEEMKAKAVGASSRIQSSFDKLNLKSEFKLNTDKAMQRLKGVHGKIKDISKEPLDFPTSFAGLAGGVGTLALPVQRAIEFEKSFAGVKKVIDGTDAEINKLRKDLIDMTAVVPKTASELNAIAESGAKMGVALKDLTQYTMIVSKASVAFDMSAEETGDAFGKIASQLGYSIPQLEKYGDIVNHLADTTASDARNIIDITKRTAGAFSSLNFDTGTIVGLSAFADQMSVSSEVGATALNQILNEMRATEQGAKMLKERGGYALIDLANKFKKLQGTARTNALEDLFGTGEGSRMFEKLINQTDVLKKSLDFALSKSTLGSMTREFKNVSETTANKIILMRNALDRLAINLGDVLLPKIKDMIVTLSPMIDTITKWAEQNKGLIMTMAKLVAVGTLFLAGLILVKLALTPLIVAAKMYTAIMSIWTGVLWLAEKAQTRLNIAMSLNVIGLIIIGIVALIAAVVALIYYWEEITGWVGELWDKITGFISSLNILSNVLLAIKGVFAIMVAPIKFVLDLLDSFLSKFEIYNKAKQNVIGFVDQTKKAGSSAWDTAKNAMGFGEDKTQNTTPIDNVNKNHTVVDVKVTATGATVTEKKATSTGGRVNLNTGSTGV